MTGNIPKRNQVHLAMFAKYWQTGKVKTRLARSIGAEAARDIHLLFVRILLQKFGTFGDRRTLVGSPAEMKLKFEEILPDSWQLRFQSDGDLGARMSHFFEVNQRDKQINILIGSDTPDLKPDYLTQAVELLQAKDLVLGPSRDGGYYLIAMQRHLADLFQDVPWSSSKVLSRTIEIAQQRSISYALLPELNDVDEIGDLRQLMTNLENTEDNVYAKQILVALSQMELSFAN